MPVESNRDLFLDGEVYNGGLTRGKGFMESHTRRQKRLRELEDRLDSLSEELKALLTNPRTAFELYVQTYVAKSGRSPCERKTATP